MFRKKEAKQPEDIRLGQVLVDMGFCDLVRIEQALRECEYAPIGRYLVETDVITEQQLEEALLQQRALMGTAPMVEVTRFRRARRRRLLSQLLDSLEDLNRTSKQITEHLKG